MASEVIIREMTDIEHILCATHVADITISDTTRCTTYIIIFFHSDLDHQAKRDWISVLLYKNLMPRALNFLCIQIFVACLLKSSGFLIFVFNSKMA